MGQIRTDAPEGTRFLVLRDNHSATTPRCSNVVDSMIHSLCALPTFLSLTASTGALLDSTRCSTSTAPVEPRQRPQLSKAAAPGTQPTTRGSLQVSAQRRRLRPRPGAVQPDCGQPYRRGLASERQHGLRSTRDDGPTVPGRQKGPPLQSAPLNNGPTPGRRWQPRPVCKNPYSPASPGVLTTPRPPI